MKRRDMEKILSSLEERFEAVRDRSTPPPYPCDEETGKISLPPHVEMELRQLAASGGKIEAVKRTTKLTGAGLKASKAYVDNLPRLGRCPSFRKPSTRRNSSKPSTSDSAP